MHLCSIGWGEEEVLSYWPWFFLYTTCLQSILCSQHHPTFWILLTRRNDTISFQASTNYLPKSIRIIMHDISRKYKETLWFHVRVVKVKILWFLFQAVSVRVAQKSHLPFIWYRQKLNGVTWYRMFRWRYDNNMVQNVQVTVWVGQWSGKVKWRCWLLFLVVCRWYKVVIRYDIQLWRHLWMV